MVSELECLWKKPVQSRVKFSAPHPEFLRKYAKTKSLRIYANIRSHDGHHPSQRQATPVTHVHRGPTTFSMGTCTLHAALLACLHQPLQRIRRTTSQPPASSATTPQRVLGSCHAKQRRPSRVPTSRDTLAALGRRGSLPPCTWQCFAYIRKHLMRIYANKCLRIYALNLMRKYAKNLMRIYAKSFRVRLSGACSAVSYKTPLCTSPSLGRWARSPNVGLSHQLDCGGHSGVSGSIKVCVNTQTFKFNAYLRKNLRIARENGPVSGVF